MSDNTNLADRNNEPSMEDILSSIRKVIAEDLVKEEAPKQDDNTQDDNTQESTNKAEQIEDFPIAADVDLTEQPLERAAKNIANPSTSTPDTDNTATDNNDVLDLESMITELPDPHALTDDDGEVLELVTLEDDLAIDRDTDSEKNETAALADPPEIAPEMDIVAAAKAQFRAQDSSDNDIVNDDANNDDFDATLDLVMDSDASDYVTADLAADMTARAGETSADDEDENVFNILPDQDLNLPAAVKKAVQETLDENAGAILNTTAEYSAIGEPDEATNVLELPKNVNAADDARGGLNTPPDLNDPDTQEAAGTSAVSQDDDMDLVKSLLADLMDEPSSEDRASVDQETLDLMPSDDENAESYGRDSLFVTEPDHSFDEEDLLIPEPPAPSTDENQPGDDTLDKTADETTGELTVENKLAQIAQEISEVQTASVSGDGNPDDLVTLEAPDLASQLALAKSLKMATPDSDDSNSLQQPPIAQSAPQVDIIADEHAEPKTPTPLPPTTQEDETMATPLKTETLTDIETQEEAGNAFASLTSAVQEKHLKDENGPAIGELVKEALKPMLQEWLDKNLKSMVQRAVNAEIKRISSGK